MKVTKLELAQIQIEKAIDLFLHDQDYVCSLTLSGAAEEILGNILKNDNRIHLLEELYTECNFGDNLKYSNFKMLMNEARDELKHSHKKPNSNDVVDVQEMDAGQMIMRCIVNFIRVRHGYTEKMIAFYNWIKINEPEIRKELADTKTK